MPRPRHPIREHFHEIPDSSRKNGAIACNYCGKEQSAGNPKRCQKHLDECSPYAAMLSVMDAGGEPSLISSNPYESTSATPTHPQAPYPGTTHPHPDGLPSNNFASAASDASSMQAQMALGSPERGMTEEHIMRLLRINDSTYLSIERDLDAQLQQLNISGAGLHTNTGRMLLKQALYQVLQRSPEVFNDLHEQDKTQALTAMANICNRKRRNGAPPSAGPITPSTASRMRVDSKPMSSTATAADAMQHLQQQQQQQQQMQGSPSAPAFRFGTTTVVAERADGSGTFVVCRPSDLIGHPKAAEDITVDDVKFMPFVSLLQQDDDVMFRPEEDKIMFTFSGGRTKTVSNEIIWHVALEEMHKKGLDPFVFKIYKRSSG